MALEVLNTNRIFKHGDVELPDPMPGKAVSRVQEFYSNTYPELTNAKVSGPVIENDKAIYEFINQLGQKG